MGKIDQKQKLIFLQEIGFYIKKIGKYNKHKGIIIIGEELTSKTYSDVIVFNNLINAVKNKIPLIIIAGPYLVAYSREVRKADYNERHPILKLANLYRSEVRLYKKIGINRDVVNLNHTFTIFDEEFNFVLRAGKDINDEEQDSPKQALDISIGTYEDFKDDLIILEKELKKADTNLSDIYVRYDVDGKISNRFGLIIADAKIHNTITFLLLTSVFLIFALVLIISILR